MVFVPPCPPPRVETHKAQNSSKKRRLTVKWIGSNWWWIVVVLMVLAGSARFLFRRWRESREEDAAHERILNLVETVLKSLHEVFKGEVHKVDREQVLDAAREVYRRFIAPTSLSKFVSEEEFTNALWEAWQEIAGVEHVVVQTVAQSARSNGHGNSDFSFLHRGSEG